MTVTDEAPIDLSTPGGRRRRATRVAAYGTLAIVGAAAAAGAFLGVRHHQIGAAEPLVTGTVAGGGTAVDNSFGPGEREISSTASAEIYQLVRNRSNHAVSLLSAGIDAGAVKPGILVRAVSTAGGHAYGADGSFAPFPATIPAGGELGLVVAFPPGCNDTSPGVTLTFDHVTLTLRYRGETLHRAVAFDRPVVTRC